MARRGIDLQSFAQGLAILVFMLDQMTKFYVLYMIDLPARHVVPLLPPVLDLAMVWNRGVTFGLFNVDHGPGRIVFAVLATGIALFLFGLIANTTRRLPALCYAAIAGGALGNVADRLRLGRVVDFIHVHWGSFDPFPWVFNIGDSAIVIGVGLLLLDSLWLERRRLPDSGAQS